MDKQDLARGDAIRRTLRAVRETLGLEVAFVSELTDEERIFRYVDSADGVSYLKVGDSGPVEESYCHYVVSGEMPEFLPDPARHPVAAAMKVTAELPVGTHLSVPIRFSDGRVYGTFCCFARDVHPEVESQDVRALRLAARLVGDYLEEHEAREVDLARRREAIRTILDDPAGLTADFQPLLNITTAEVVSVEALARFSGVEGGSEAVFAEAWEVGLGVELELKAVRTGLEALPKIPRSIRLNINASPRTLVSPDFYEAVSMVPPHRLVLEITEHAAIDDYAALRAVGERLATLGIRMSIDDMGAGFSGFTRILETPADELKIDRAIIHEIHFNPVKQEIVRALVSLCGRVDLGLVAEGIETDAEVEMLRSLGVVLGQGHYFARPAPLDTIFHNGSQRLFGASGLSKPPVPEPERARQRTQRPADGISKRDPSPARTC
ncbi:MAG: EAL domain-containing protein [Actinomycetota bacterium]